jgi:dTDP-4-amino-4,6-dideoxygalactose transaminase
MDAIETLARRRGLAVVADAAQAVGAAYGGRPVAAWGDACCLSFYPTKNLGACGDGGMVLTTRDDVAERVRLLRDHGAPRKYVHVELGYSSRLDELQAALLRVKLRHLPAWTEARRRLAGRYLERLRGLDLELPVERPPARHVYHQFIVRTAKREALRSALGDLGVGTSVHYPSTLPGQPLFSRRDAERDFPHAAQAAAEVLGLPCFPEIEDGEVDAVVECVRQAVGRIA